MPNFIYKARRPSGEIYSGEKEAADRYDLYRTLRGSGDEAFSIKEKKISHIRLNIFGLLTGNVNTAAKINLARNLGAMLEAGLSLSRALSVLERQAHGNAVKKVLRGLTDYINEGSSFSESLSKFPKTFSPLFISMVRAGEQSGSLSESLKVLAKQMESSYKLQKRIRGALIYPGVIFTVMIIIAVLMLIFVIPSLTKTFMDFNVELPITTRIVLGTSSIVKDNGLIVLFVLIIASLGIWRWIKTPFGKSAFHKSIIKLPIIGPLAIEVNSARTARTLASLLTSGVEVVEALDITANVVQNVHFKAVLKQAEDTVKRGEPMSKVFGEHPELYPVFFYEMINVGEETGKTGEMLLDVAHYYEDDVDQKTKDMSTVIEPILMVIIGAAVGFFAVSMISPIYSLVNAI